MLVPPYPVLIKSSAAIKREKRRDKKRYLILFPARDDRWIRSSSPDEKDGLRVHYLCCMNNMGICQRCDQKRMRLEIQEHFADEITGKTDPDFALKTVIISAEYVCFKKLLDFFQRHKNLNRMCSQYGFAAVPLPGIIPS